MTEKDPAQELLDMKEKAKKAEQKTNEYTGQLNQLYQNLTDEFGCESNEEAKEKLDNMKNELEKLDEELETEIRRIKNEYGFDQTLAE